MDKKKIQQIDEEIELEMYNKAIDYLTGMGYQHYEISNFAKDAYKCKHNIGYWKNQEYLGLGVAAHSHINKKRFSNFEILEDYCKSIREGKKPLENVESISINDEISETMFLGLRMMEGISVEQFKARFDINPKEIYGAKLKKLKDRQLINYNNTSISLTRTGIALANQVFQEMILD